LLPPSPKDWLSEDHLVYFISETVDRLDLSGFYRRYEGDGRRNRPFDPRLMVKLLLYGYATGVFSSRKLAKKLEEDVAFRVLGAGNFPAHRTICEFRQRHLEEFQELFVELVRVAREAGMIRLGTVAVDGAKVKANASKRKAGETQDRGGPSPLQETQSDCGTGLWVGQAGVGISPLQSARNREGHGRVGLGVPGGQSETDEQPDPMDLEVAEGAKEPFYIVSMRSKLSPWGFSVGEHKFLLRTH